MDARALTRRMRGGVVAAVATGLAIAGAAGMAVAARGHTVHVKQALAPVGGGKAKGKLLLVVHSGKTRLDGSLDVGVRHLGRNSQYEVLVEGVHVGGLTTNGGGNGHARFRTTPKGHALVLGIDPRGKQVVIRDADGHDVLEGDCPDDPDAAGKVACCVPPESGEGAFTHGEDGDGQGQDGDGDGHHGHHDGDDDCRLLTVDACAAVGGSSAGGSCLPDPCTTTPPVPSGTVCCVPEEDNDDGEGAECRVFTPDHCAAEHGTMISAAGCDPNPCEPTPPADPRIVCCGGEHGGECEHRTAAECDAHQGVNKGPGSCDPNPCGNGDGGGDGDDGD